MNHASEGKDEVDRHGNASYISKYLPDQVDQHPFCARESEYHAMRTVPFDKKGLKRC